MFAVIRGALVLAVLFRTVGCSDSALLEGRYHLVPRGQCALGEIVSDVLVLNDGGTLEQHTVLKSGAPYDSVTEKWKYLGNKTIQLDSWSDFSHATAADRLGVKKSVVLKVEPSHPQVIFVPSGCIYTQPK